ncbi:MULTISPECIES: STAS domain-containing protein [Hymenobacter]|uniref:Anti-sigma factor antagonist n=2 Tax=Hymenobacter TaxID=89966 RepID=A0ABS6X429_9BACT|nr:MULTISPECIES: STAS domain-containing protein [Hymenobacter]MBO3272693.1 STAS domain-containing protein [Hymenobacter defluvii]MBW3130232.1 STAS domain-containing protein [Hymenobacter profundi]QNE40605.1 STAS domain-containing protein [Hymenobacter sp. NBH84]
MKITQQATDTSLTLNLDGELDASSSVILDTELSKSEVLDYQKILIDCQRLNYISSAGLGVFISHLQRLQDANVKLIFYNMQEKVHNVFEILGLDSLMTIVPTQAEAVAI